MTDANSWLMGGAVPSAKFDAHGDTVKGTITETPELRQQTNFETQQPEFWDDGKPKMQLVVTLATDQRDPSNPEDEGIRRLYVKGKMQQAVASAIRKCGAKGLEVGGTLTIAYVGDDEPKKRGMSGAKLYLAEYASPAAAFLAQDEPAAAAAPAAQVPAQAAPPATAAPADAAALLGSLTPEQLAALAAMQQKATAPF